MAENRQNSETEKNNLTANDKTTVGGAASTKQAREENSKPNDTGGKQNEAAAKANFEQTKESVGEFAGQALGQAKDKAVSVIGDQKTNLATGINSVADSIRQIGENIGGKDDDSQIAALAGKYGDSLAGQVEKFSSYVEDKDFKEIMGDVETFARRNPAMFVGGAFLLGVAAARFLKSSGSGQTAKRRSLNNSEKKPAAHDVSATANKIGQSS